MIGCQFFGTLILCDEEKLYSIIKKFKKKKAGSQIPAFPYSHMMVLCEPKMIL